MTNLVHRRILTPVGPSFVSNREEKHCEFLASTDSWFHPVNTTTGPDGALYIVDFYRRWVEHPQFVPPSLRAGVDWREGEGRGRLWRIRLAGTSPRHHPPRLSEAGTGELAVELEHVNGWRRDTAQRLLIERRDPHSVTPLRKAAVRNASAVARAHALWTLNALDGLDEATLLRALSDNSPDIREQAVRLAAERKSPSAELRSALCALADDPSLTVRFRLGLSLDALADDQRLAIWVLLARQADAAPWLFLSVSAALDGKSAWPFLKRLAIEDPKWLQTASWQQANFLRETAALLRDDRDAVDLLAFLGRQRASQLGVGHLALVAGLSQAVLSDNRSLSQWLADEKVEQIPATDALRAVLDIAHHVAADRQAEVFERTNAISVVSLDNPARSSPLLLRLLDAAEPQEVQSGAVAALGGMADAEIARRMLERWGGYTAATRRAVAAAAMRHPAAVEVLVNALELGEVSAIELDPSQRVALASIHDVALRQRVQKVLQNSISTDRGEVVARYEAVLKQPGDRRRGAALVRQHCLACHAIQGLGHRVGADLSGAVARPTAALLEDILDPSRQILANYMAYTLVTNDGQILSGVLAAESAAAVTLRRADGVEETVPRSRIDELRASGKSLMPDGFEQKLGVQDMADVLEFLAHPERELLEP